MTIISNPYHYYSLPTECLTRPEEKNSIEVAKSAESLARVSYKLLLKNGPSSDYADIIEAEFLVRKAIRIKEVVYKTPSPVRAQSLNTLSDILQLKGDRNEEVQALLEEMLSIYSTSHGADSINVLVINSQLCKFHFKSSLQFSLASMKREELQKAEKYGTETVRLSVKIHGPTHVDTVGFEARVFSIMEAIHKVI